jgi:transglutaminase-like putative cysteine protease
MDSPVQPPNAAAAGECPADDTNGCTGPTFFIESDHPRVVRYARDAVAGATDAPEQARRLYRAIRDGIRYNPYLVSDDPAEMQASRVLEVGEGFCVPKAILMAACARSLGIPARLRFADVVNHFSSPKLMALMNTDVFHYHGYNELWLEGHWVKVTPTFNRELCDRFGVDVLEFDGRNDAVMQPFDRDGKQFMEYVLDHGCFSDVPFETLMSTWKGHYPAIFSAATFSRETDRIFHGTR